MASRFLVFLLLTGFGASALADGLPIYVGVGGLYSEAESGGSRGLLGGGTVGPVPPSEFSVEGQRFDDDDTGWDAVIGYQFIDWFALELGYQDLGTVESDSFFSASLDTEAVTLVGQFRYRLTERLHATWHIGFAAAEFEADGSANFIIIDPTDPFPPLGIGGVLAVDYGDPDDETGYLLGFGLSWQLSSHFDLEARYSRQDLDVLEFDTFGIRLVGRL